MATTQTYKVLFNNVTVKSSPFLLSSTLGKLKKNTLVEVIDITVLWARIKYNNKYGYVIILCLKKVKQIITGSITIKYLNVDTNVEVLQTVTKDNLSLNTYSYTAPTIENYTVIEPSTKSVTLTNSNPNQEIVFYYKENIIYGSVTVNYVDKSTNQSISKQKIYKDLNLGTYSYSAIDITGYKINGDSSKSVTLTKYAKDQSITFEYDKILGKVTVEYVDIDTKLSIATADVYSSLDISSYTYSAKSIDGYTLVGESSQTITLTYSNNEIILTFEYKKNITDDDIYVIDLKKYGISNDNANATTIGINQALVDAKTAGYKRVKLPEGVYSIDTSVKNPIVLSDGTNKWTHNRQGISMQSDMELILDNAILEMIPTDDPYYSIINISNCKNSKITGGAIFGDKKTHNYGMRINENGTDLEPGAIDESTGELINSNDHIRTGFIEKYVKYDTKEEVDLPNKMCFIPLWNTYFNTVDGGKKRVFCYNENNKYLGISGGWEFNVFELLEGTKKIRIMVLNEQWYDNDYTTNVYALTTRTLYQTAEFAMGINICDSNNIEINGTTVKNIAGDCITTFAPPLKTIVDNLKILNCDLYGSRRQCISFVATGENYLIQNCKIHDINGIDPQFGIDIEHYDYVKNVIIDNCDFYNNRKGDIINYNGTDHIEVKNSRFNGAVVSTFGINLIVHDCKFECFEGVNDSNKRTKMDALLSLSTNGNVAYNNVFNNAKFYIKNPSAITYNNEVYNGNATISSYVIENRPSNKYYNSSVGIVPQVYFDYYTGGYFENCEITINNNKNNLTIKDINFKNSILYPSNETTFDSCIFDMYDKSVMDGWRASGTDLTFINCKFNSLYKSDIRLLGSNLNVKATFNNCNFNISRYTLALSYGNLTFNDSYFVFNDLNTSKYSIDLNKSGYGYQICPWHFNNCYFKSNLPIKVTGSNVINPTIDGPITVS